MLAEDEFKQGLYLRQTLLDKTRRVVVKVGSAVLTGEEGIDQGVVHNLAKELSFLHDTGREVILVTSGAVAAGRKKINISSFSKESLKEKQALAAIGQSCLMQTYDTIFSLYNKQIAQILLTHSDLADRDRYLNIRNTLLTLLKLGVIPIINENDTVSVEELRFGDNDNLGALVTNLIEADMFICLTDVSGLYDGDPSKNSNAEPVYTVDKITPAIEAMVGNVKSSLGTGGMMSKINAARIVSSGGGSSIIGPGKESNVLQKLFGGEKIGTFFLPSKEKMHLRKHWIAHVVKAKGSIVIDQGAETAVIYRGKSLLPSGIKSVDGVFGVGDAIDCFNNKGKRVCVGLVNYCAEDVKKIRGKKSEEIEKTIGFKDSDEVIHRDNLVLLNVDENGGLHD